MADLDPAIKALAEQIGRAEDLDGAAGVLDQMLAAAPEDFQLLQLAGAAAFRRGDFAAAGAYFHRATHASPVDAGTRNNLGQALRAEGKFAEARAAFWRALDLDTVFAEPAMNLGLLAAADGDWASAVGFYAQALTRRSNYGEAHFNWAIALERLGQAEGAVGHYRRALQFRPGYIMAINNLAALKDQEGSHGEAEALFRDGLAEATDIPELWSGLGSNQRAQGNLAGAREAYGRALALKPDFPECRWNLALVQLAEGDFSTGEYGGGWSNYRYRPSADRRRTPFPKAPFAPHRWPGPVDILGEQGLGDELFFLRFVRDLAGQGADIRYAPDPKLRTMLERLDFIKVVPAEDLTDGVSAADLPYLMAAEATPPSVRLDPDPAHLTAMAAKLAAAGPGPYLGLTWRAGLKQPGSLYKEIPMQALAGAVRDWPGTLVNLQRGPGPGEQAPPGADFSACNDDLEDMLALMTLIDRVAGVSNTNMHLRGLVGGTAAVLVTNPAEYRWMGSGTSPWFPDFHLYRQAADGSWAGALDGLRRALI